MSLGDKNISNISPLYDLPPHVQELKQKLIDFVYNECIPSEKIFEEQLPPIGHPDRWNVIPQIQYDLCDRAKKLGLWNVWLPSYYKESRGFTNLQYAHLCEIMGRCHLSSIATNCAAPDTGNIEVLAKYGTDEQKKKWLVPLMNGEIRSAFSMTEPGIASSDATNIQLSISREGNEYVLNGRKWWISGAGDPRCKLHIVMGKTSFTGPKHKQQSVILVPSNTPGIKIVRPMLVYGFDDAPHGHMEVHYDNVRVPLENIVLGEGRGFEIIQGRLGPGRIHHCMRALGQAERAIEWQLLRLTSDTKTFGKELKDHGSALEELARSRIKLNGAKLLVLHAAHQMDLHGPKAAMNDIAIAKALVPTVVGEILDRAIQTWGAVGISQDTPLAGMWLNNRTLRFADGPDEVHLRTIGRNELKRVEELHSIYKKNGLLIEKMKDGKQSKL